MSLCRLGLLSLLTSTLVGCSSFVDGNGVYAELTFDAGSRDLGPFDGAVIGFSSDVDVSGHPLTASIVVDGGAARQVVLSGDENVIQHIHPRVDGHGVLRTEIDVDGYSSVHPPQLRVKATELASLGSVGGSEITALGVAAASFSVTASSGGHVVLSGAGGSTLSVALSGGALLDAAAYPVTSAELALSGASSATVWPSGELSGTIASGSTVLVKGPVTCAGVVVSGTGSACGPL